MGTLKFGIYDKTEKRMKFFDSIWNMPDPSYDFDEVQQFIGRKDKNEKDIYTGYILKRGENIGYVWYCDVCARYEFKILISGLPTEGAWQSIDFPLSDPDSDEEDEIIGNIYENIELFKK